MGDLEIIILSEVSQTEKEQKSRCMGIENKLAVSSGEKDRVRSNIGAGK